MSQPIYDRIFVENIQLYAHHGVYAEELKLGQKFEISLSCKLDPAPYTHDDHLRQTVSYARLTEIVVEASNAGPFKLVETLGETIALNILSAFPTIAEVSVTIVKPGAAVGAVIAGAGAEITRQRQENFAIALGSNLGEKAQNLRAALAMLGNTAGIKLEAVSSFYKTPPWGNTSQDWFVNAVITGITSLSPQQLFLRAKQIEFALGRLPAPHWGPRLIDLDVLFYGTREVKTERLTLPHPRMLERAFVLVPLAEILPEGHQMKAVVATALEGLAVVDVKAVELLTTPAQQIP